MERVRAKERRIRARDEAIRLLENSGLGIHFDKYPEVKKLSFFTQYINSVHSIYSDRKLFAHRSFPPTIIPFITALSVAKSYMRSSAIYDHSTQKYYDKNTYPHGPNPYGENTISGEDNRRYCATHELTHAYIHQRKHPSENPTEKTIEDIKKGKNPNLESVYIERAWKEGLCDFAAIYSELTAIQRGDLDANSSVAPTIKLNMGGIKKIRQDEVQIAASLLDPLRLEVNETQLSRQKEIYTKAFFIFNNREATRRITIDDVKWTLIAVSNLQKIIHYNLGYVFAQTVFTGLVNSGRTPAEAFEYMINNPPEYIAEIIAPETYLEKHLLRRRSQPA